MVALAGALDWVETYQAAKTLVVDGTGLTKDALHLWFALLIQFGVAQVCRRRLASLWPVLAVIAAETANELFDYNHYWLQGPDPMAGWLVDTVKDVLSTMAMPLVLFVLARFRPDRLIGLQRGTTGASDAAGDDVNHT